MNQKEKEYTKEEIEKPTYKCKQLNEQQKELLVEIIDRKLQEGIDDADLKTICIAINGRWRSVDIEYILDELATIKEIIKESI